MGHNFYLYFFCSINQITNPFIIFHKRSEILQTVYRNKIDFHFKFSFKVITHDTY